MANPGEWEIDIEGNFQVHTAISRVLPKSTEIISAESCGTSSWTKTAKLCVKLPDGSSKRYFVKCIKDVGARALVEGEYHSATAIEASVPDFTPKTAGWGQYNDGESMVYFYLGDFHDMDLAAAPEPEHLISQLVELHQRGVSPTGLFGFPVPTVLGEFQRTVTWKKSWAKAFARQLEDVYQVVPRLLGALQSEGRELKPSLIHGDFWENIIGIDMETGKTIAFDPGCTYAHNEMEFGTWRCSWALYFNSPTYIRLYLCEIEPSEPVEEWDDRNRLYSIHPYLNDSAGHPGSVSRELAYNDILYLCEKYAPLDTLAKYDPSKDISVTGAYVPFTIHQLD